jgi:hypothetical protein
MVPIVHTHVSKGSNGRLNGDLVQLMGTVLGPILGDFDACSKRQFLASFLSNFWIADGAIFQSLLLKSKCPLELLFQVSGMDELARAHGFC